ncbi:MAG TPA: hypothetical protein PKO06_10105, partial [Candidatus Ozemobacteraceae bacterium]|nr:hypothetical protein [Candidatus Ozemobacteraceae bacterium]
MSTFSPNNSYCSARFTFVLTLLTLVIPCIALAGELNAPAAPNDAGSAMFSIEAIYQRLLNGSTGDKRGGTPGTFKEPAGAPAGTSHTLNDVMGVAPVKDTVDGASPDQVLTGKKFWGLKDGAGWGAQIGQMANHGAMEFTPGAATQTIPQGYYDGNGKVRGDANLVTGNIKAGTTIFGVTGKTEVVDTTSGDATAEEILSGNKAWVGGVEVTGTREPDAFPFSGTRWSNTGLDANGRWCDNGDGTVTD